jgi:hypothetical protein
MKKLYTILKITACFLCLMSAQACKKSYLEKGAIGSVTESTLANKAGVDGLLTGAYSLLDGVGNRDADFWNLAFASGPSNWIYGGVAADDAHKGSEYGDQPPIVPIENHTVTPTNTYINAKWSALYAGIQRANDVLRIMATVKDGSISVAEAKQIKAEAIFLRAVYHLEAAKIWKNVPYVDESVSYANENYNVSNTVSIWPKLEADFQFAIANLTALNPQPGRANSWAAKAFLSEMYLFEHNYVAAKPLLADIIANGVICSGKKYALGKFSDNFNPSTKNGPESVFAVQMFVGDPGTSGYNGNVGDALNFPIAGPSTCCGFNQPSFSLVNSFKTDAVTGLPLLDTWNDQDVKNDLGVASSAPFTPYGGTLDPRLDHTVGRRGIPYLDWGIMPGQAWIRAQDQGGPYLPIKNMYYKSQQGTTSNQDYWGGQATSNNVNMIRFAEVLLWAAECEVEIGSIAQAENYVNMIRNRAVDNSDWVKADVANGGSNYNGYSANYFIKPYPEGSFALNGQDYARKAIRFEEKLEMAMEGKRFFNLQRWDNGSGYMANVLNAYIKHETTIPGFNYQTLNGASFVKMKNEYFPIPQVQIDLSVSNGTSSLKQNQGY